MHRPHLHLRTSRIPLVVAIVSAAAVAVWPTGTGAAQAQPPLATAANYAVIANSTITNTGGTVITGGLALSPGTSVTGGPVVIGRNDVADNAASTAQTDLGTAYSLAAGATSTADETGTDLGGLTLTPGVYTFSSSAQLTGALILDGKGATNPTFIFQVGTTLTTAPGSSVSLINGAGSCAVFWQVGSSATIDTTTAFAGNVMAHASITMNGGAILDGRAMAMTAAVTLDNNSITAPPIACPFVAAAAPPTPTPTPTATPTTTPSATPTATPSPTPTATPGATATPAPTATPSATPAPTAAPTGRPVPTATPVTTGTVTTAGGSTVVTSPSPGGSSSGSTPPSTTSGPSVPVPHTGGHGGWAFTWAFTFSW